MVHTYASGHCASNVLGDAEQVGHRFRHDVLLGHFFWVATTAQSPLFSATVVMFSWAIALKAYSGGEMRMSDWIQWSRKCQDTNPLGRGVPPERRS